MTTTKPKYEPPFEQAVRKKAREIYHEEGTLEIDDDAIVSQSEGGCYVAAWVWVPDEDESDADAETPETTNEWMWTPDAKKTA